MMKFLCASLLICISGAAYAQSPHDHITRLDPNKLRPDPVIEHQELHQDFLTEYGMGVQRLPMDGGKIYGWKINDTITVGRFKGENDGFGVSFDVNRRQRVEVTNEGIRWRMAIGGKH